MPQYTTTLDAQGILDSGALERLGGKGRSLAAMAQAGFKVPPAFLVTASAYRRFVSDNGLQPRIIELAKPAVAGNRVSFDGASESVQALFEASGPGAEISDEVASAYQALGDDVPVAVRSSANAEDLPDLSFAGQQETFLNVRGEEEVIAAVRACWASLWTARAIDYRHQNGIDQNGVAMAVVVQVMVPSAVSGILFTANPATGERSEMVINASFGLGEAVVSGEVTPDTYIVDRATGRRKETVIGAKEHMTVSAGAQGTRMEDVPPNERDQSSLADDMVKELTDTSLAIEKLYDGVPQDIEWAFSADGTLSLLQSRPITNLPVQPIEVTWEPTPPAKILYRRQIVENMPDPICELFEELYLTEGLEYARRGMESMVRGGGAHFVTCNGYAYCRADHKGTPDDPNMPLEEMEAMSRRMLDEIRQRQGPVGEKEVHDMALFLSELSEEDRAAFQEVADDYQGDNLAHDLTMPESDNPTYVANHKTQDNDQRWKTWQDEAMPRLIAAAEKWQKLDISAATDEQLLAGIREMAIEEGFYWSGNTSHTFGIAKSTDDHLQCFLRENLPDHHFISGQFLTGLESKTMQANTDLFEIAKVVRASVELSHLVIVTPPKFLMQSLREHPDGGPVLKAIDAYFEEYGHQGYSLDFIEPTQEEDPSALLATLKTMVQDTDYDPKDQELRAAGIRQQKYGEVSELLEGLTYWQFRYRLWFARKYNHIREETAFYFGYTWRVLRPMAFELGKRMVDAGTFRDQEDTFFLVTEELREAISARQQGQARPELGRIAAERRELREARKRHHPPGTIPPEASNIPTVRFKETQIRNDPASDTLNGFAVSSGTVTAPASVVLSQTDFEKMSPGTILVAPNTTPAWTQLFSHAVGVVTDMGSILAHASIVAREYGIPAVLGVGNGTTRIRHGQMLTINGDAGNVLLHEEESAP
ncbi:MAG: PEP-utilizing enzyme [Gammaproteobacteria bacterium]|nr:PEP-utilizing enzyme [Gammaproteobacteria bacterium]